MVSENIESNLFQAKVANYIGIGIDWSCIEKKNYRNTIKLKLGQYKVKLIQEKVVFSHEIKSGDIYHTTNLEIKGIKKLKEGEKVVNNICSLLSLASTSQVVPFKYKFKGQSKKILINRKVICRLPLIEINNGNSVKDFLESTWTTFRKLKTERKLTEVIDMLTYAELPIQPLEIKLAQIFIILENLKATNADVKGIPFKNGFYKKVSSPPKTNLAKEKNYSFEELMKLMFNEVGMNPSLKRIKTLRNQIIHFGLSKRPYDSLQKHYGFCQNIVREYLLRKLNFHGSYLIYSQRNTVINNL